jgi:hypothetical protein
MVRMMEMDIVGLKEIAMRMGVKQQTAAAWRHRGLLPAPEGTVSGAPAWQWQTIEEWAIRTGRVGGVAEFVAESTPAFRVLDFSRVQIGAGVVVRQVSQPFPQPMEDGRLESHVRIQAALDDNWYQLAQSAYLRATGTTEDTATRVGKALLAGAAIAGAIIVIGEASKQGRLAG